MIPTERSLAGVTIAPGFLGDLARVWLGGGGAADTQVVDQHRELGQFLQTRRSQIRPDDVGVTPYGERRRVPGLRREELAMLAGVSPSYYSRLEQGQSTNASAQVLDAIADALQLNEAERRHLHDLANGRRRQPRGRGSPIERVSSATLELVTALAELPAVVLGWRSDVLAWNPMGHALFAGHLEFDSPLAAARRPNMAQLVFTDVHTRELYTDWPAKARAVVGTLRVAAGQHPDDARLASLVGKLMVASPDFGSMWADHRVKTGGASVYEMRHPLVGSLHVTQQTLQMPDGQSLVLATTEEGSSSEAAMTLLAHGLAKRRDIDSQTRSGSSA